MLEVRWINEKLFIGSDAVAGCEVLPIIRMRLRATQESTPQTDKDYIPPVLACDAWWLLSNESITWIYNYVYGQADKWASKMIDDGIGFESVHREDLQIILKTHRFNAALRYLCQLTEASHGALLWPQILLRIPYG